MGNAYTMLNNQSRVLCIQEELSSFLSYQFQEDFNNHYLQKWRQTLSQFTCSNFNVWSNIFYYTSFNNQVGCFSSSLTQIHIFFSRLATVKIVFNPLPFLGTIHFDICCTSVCLVFTDQDCIMRWTMVLSLLVLTPVTKWNSSFSLSGRQSFKECKPTSMYPIHTDVGRMDCLWKWQNWNSQCRGQIPTTATVAPLTSTELEWLTHVKKVLTAPKQT